MLILKASALQMRMDREKQLSLLDKLIFVHINFKSALAMFLNISKIAY